MKIPGTAVKRFAVERLLPLLKSAGKDVVKTVKPDFSTGQGMLDAAFRFGPDLMFPLVAASMAPEGTGGLTRTGLALEDLGINLLTSIGGQYGGRKLGNRLLAKGGNPAVAGMLQSAGDLVAMPAQMFSPRPLFNKVIQDAGLNERELLEAQIRKEEQEKMEAIINALLVGGGTAGLALRPRRSA
tara:strand:+ start:97 stop:651 length:555 start_codon:yes stop_codon:yes gene_type:complete